MSEESQMSKFEFLRSIPNVIFLALLISAAVVLAWVGIQTLTESSLGAGDIGAVFFGDRTGEGISLGIGMTVFHYFLIGVSLLAAGLAMFVKIRFFTVEPQLDMPQAVAMKNEKVKMPQKSTKQPTKMKMKEETAAAQEERFFSGCLHHFGYLSSRPKDSPIPQECILCQRLGDCMVATIYVKKVNE